MKVTPHIRRSVKIMRIVMPLVTVMCVILAGFSYIRGDAYMLALDFALATVNAFVSWVEWCVFEL